MGSIEDQITELEDEIRRTQHNKATEGHIGHLRAKIAALKIEREKRAKGSGGGVGYAVRKSGHATVALVGYPSVGKSTLLTRLTGAASEAAAYEFTTTTIIPGMLSWRGANIQILDMPGLVKGASQGRGRGRVVLSVARASDLILFILDGDHIEFRSLLKELENANIRVNARPPNISVTKLEKGGIQVESTVRLTRMNPELASSITREFGIHNALIIFREDASVDQLIDVLAGNRVYIPAIYVLNKADLIDKAQKKVVQEKLTACKPLFVSASKGEGIEPVKDAIGEALAFIRIYMKPQGKGADMSEPLILRRGSCVRDMLKRLPVDLSGAFKAAQVWGRSAKFPGQRVGKDHILEDQDVVTVLLQRG
jgi:hypothetical protein